MKLTKEYIKQIIKEELDEASGVNIAAIRAARKTASDRANRPSKHTSGTRRKAKEVYGPPDIAKKVWEIAFIANSKNPGSGKDYMNLGNFLSTKKHTDKQYLESVLEDMIKNFQFTDEEKEIMKQQIESL